MSMEQMLDSQIFSWFMQTFHINGLTTYISRFFAKQGIDYAVFYEKLWNYLIDDPWFAEEKESVRTYYRNWMTYGEINHPAISNIEIHGWNIIHRTTLRMHLNRRYNYVFALIEDFVSNNFDLDSTCLEQLLIFQKNYVINYDNISMFPYAKSFDYDFLGYLIDDTSLEIPVTYRFEFQDGKDISLDRFLENIYFSRKRNFGKSLITKE
jgi:hypothetical protein